MTLESVSSRSNNSGQCLAEPDLTPFFPPHHFKFWEGDQKQVGSSHRAAFLQVFVRLDMFIPAGTQKMLSAPNESDSCSSYSAAEEWWSAHAHGDGCNSAETFFALWLREYCLFPIDFMMIIRWKFRADLLSCLVGRFYKSAFSRDWLKWNDITASNQLHTLTTALFGWNAFSQCCLFCFF